MESTNLHLHHQIEGSDSSQVQTSSSCFSVGSNDHASSHWKSSNLPVESSNNIHASGCEDQDPNNNPMVQELSFVNWPNNAINPSSFPHLIPNIKIKQESLASNHHHHNFDNYSCFQKLSDLLKNPSLTNSSSTSDDQMLLLKTHMLTNDYHHNNSNFPSLLDPNKELITNFSHIFPSVNISNLINDDDSSSNNMVSSFSLSSNSSTLEMNDLQGGSNNRFGSARFVSEGSEINPPSPSSHLIELINGSSTFDVDHKHRQHSSDLKLWNSTNNLLSINNNNGVQETKRSSCIVEPNKSTMPKKARFEASCPPLKVRKEKLGDRIAALQQLVAPFGKTDTASVLMEAIGYIKFLQNQVETLSVPYMKLSSRNKTNNNITERVLDDQNKDDDEPKQDLRSRGLCLVPVSCMSYLASDASNGGVWLPSNFNPTF